MASSSNDDGTIDWAGKVLKITTAADAAPIIESIQQHPNATSLVLSGNTFGVEACGAIGEALLHHAHHLRSANLSDIFTTRLKTDVPPSIASFTRAFTAIKTLEELNLSDNALGKDGVAAFTSLFDTNPALKHVLINNCGLGSRGGIVLARSLVSSQGHLDHAAIRALIPSLDAEEDEQDEQAAQHSDSASASASASCAADQAAPRSLIQLETLVAGRNRLENIGATALGHALQHVTSITRLEIPQNGIQPPGIVALCAGLAKNPSLQVLNLNDNTIKTDGAHALAAALLSLPHLRKLNLGDCMLGSEGVRIIAKALANSSAGATTELEELDLSYCDIDDDAARAVAKAVRQQPRLVRLELNGNLIKTDGLTAISDAIKSLGKDDVLGSMSENENSDDDGDDDDDDDNDGDDDDDEDVKKATSKMAELSVAK